MDKFHITMLCLLLCLVEALSLKRGGCSMPACDRSLLSAGAVTPGGSNIAASSAAMRLRGGHGDIHNQRTLLSAARDGELSRCAEIICKGTNPNFLLESEDHLLQVSPLHIASLAGHVEVVQKLVELGAVVNMGNKKGYSPLHCAALMGNLETCKRLVALGADLGATDIYGDQPVDRAEQAEFKDTGKWLAEEMNMKHIRRQWGGYSIPNGMQELLNEPEKQERILSDSPVDLIPRFMLDAEGTVLPEYRPVAELVQSKREMIERRGEKVTSFERLLELVKLDEEHKIEGMLCANQKEDEFDLKL